MNDNKQFISKKLVKNISLMQMQQKYELREYKLSERQNHKF